MASTVLRSTKAIQMSIYIVRAFVRMREAMSTNEVILRRLAEIDKTLLMHDEGLRPYYAPNPLRGGASKGFRD